MEGFVKGDVIILPFPYTDLSTAKKRPALVIATLKGENIILAQITTNKRDDEDLISLGKKDFASGFLKHDSFVMLSIIFTAEISTIAYKIGKLKQEKIKQVEEKLCEIFTR
ncbi:MAG TPA: type II toxin-antitoxin system PemK/MazF family toxin [Candidatus Nanoarchaeia archaeon]|nr:type II toxin-antitoxin system PemK/MazF family toxin [Candidatus Nanoarchaeia archaeon]